MTEERLQQEARRLLLSDATSAEAVAYEVGYASASQFNREYVRPFGQPPRRDAERLRAAASGGGRSTYSRILLSIPLSIDPDIFRHREG